MSLGKLSFNWCVSHSFTPLHLLVSNMRRAVQHPLPVLPFLLYLDRMTNLMEEQNASSCQTKNKTTLPVCVCAKERGENVTLRKKKWMKNDDDHTEAMEQRIR